MRLPAYGCDLQNLQRSGRNVAWLCIALDFSLGGALPRLVITDDSELGEIDLSIVAGLECLIAHKGKSKRAMEVAEVAMRHGAKLATIHNQTTGETITTAEVLAIRGMQ